MDDYKVSVTEVEEMGRTIENLMLTIKELKEDNKNFKKALLTITAETREDYIFEIANNTLENSYQ